MIYDIKLHGVFLKVIWLSMGSLVCDMQSSVSKLLLV
jgi:hypothetical protein